MLLGDAEDSVVNIKYTIVVKMYLSCVGLYCYVQAVFCRFTSAHYVVCRL